MLRDLFRLGANQWVAAICCAISVIFTQAFWNTCLLEVFFPKEIEHLLFWSHGNVALQWPAMFVVIIMMTAGILYFVVPFSNQKISNALYWGCWFGFVTYGTYGIGNAYMVNGWPLSMGMVVMAWGIASCGFVSMVTVWLRK